MNENSPLSGVNVVLVMAYGSLVFVLLFIFVKRQIMRFAVKSRRGPHVPVGHNAPKELKEEIESRLSKVNNIRYEPRLLSQDDDRLKHRGQNGSGEVWSLSQGTRGTRRRTPWTECQPIAGHNCTHPFTFTHYGLQSAYSTCLWTGGGNRSTRRKPQKHGGNMQTPLAQGGGMNRTPNPGGCYNYLYRMQALDAIRDTGVISPDLARSPSALTGPCYRKWLLDLRNTHSLIKASHSSLIDRLLEGYENARHGTAVFGEAEFLKYKEDLAELAAIVKVHASSNSLNQQHQSAAKDLTSSPGPSSASTIQVTYLPSSGQRSKRPKHFLELKNFKDNYNTLESTL
ncbi:protein C1orf43 homolog isoform X1 [Ictalurus furcatus]|uniref:protein C1orf43 homolog isoform X1 n=1 Tax=Ictalurus furcatus TaxID=66913 RepID=UPI002350CD5B|nr:protein C1orf43 homolog isoform X1 [Ictalurus furcatus]